MVSTFTPNRGYEQPGTGDYVDSWGPVVNDNFAVIDSNISSTLTVSLNSSNVTLNATQAENMAFLLTGTLGADVSLIYPAVGAFFIVRNTTTGSFRVTVITSAPGSVGVEVSQGQIAVLYSNGTNVYFADDAARLPPGFIGDYGGGTVPVGWLLCDGAAISRTLYPALFTAIGTTWGAGDGSTTFNKPDLRGRARAGRDDMGGSAAGRLTTAGSGVNGLTVGAAGGAQNVTLVTAQLPIFTPSGTVFVTYPSQGYLLATGGTSYLAGSSASAFNGYSNASTSAPNGITFGLSINQIGGGQAHNNMPPVAVVNSIIKY